MENESERAVHLKKPHHYLPLKTEKKESSKVLKDLINTSRIAEQTRYFALPVSANELEKAACEVASTNTQFNTQWTERNFTTWAIQQDAIASDDPVPLNLLSRHNPVLVLWRHIMQSHIHQQHCDYC